MELRAITAVAVLALAGCGGPVIVTSSGGVVFESRALDFGRAWVGHSAVRTVTVRNEARSSRTATLTVMAPFTLSSSILEIPGGGRAAVEVTLTPAVEGRIEGSLSLGAVQLPLSALASQPLPCPAAAACHQVAFDPASGSCLDTRLADGTSCTGDACIENGHCQAGVCRGSAQTCDDANACTADSCGADGCIHSTRSCPAPADPCQVPSCDPVNGCATEQAPDGTRCGAGDCTTAHVCMAGACVERPVPEGASCGAATPCAAAPTCQAGACVASEPRALVEDWTYAPAANATLASFGSQDPNGNFYFLEYIAAATQFQLVSLTRDGAVRFKVPAGASAARGPIDVANQQLLLISRYRTIEARALADGRPRWSVDLFEEMKPLFDRGEGAHYNFSIYEMTLVSPTAAVLSVHEDAAAWRSWAVGVNLFTGRILWSREHPGHLSGFVSDAKGDILYLESAGWGGSLTLFARDATGIQLWSRVLPYSSPLGLVDGALLLRGLNQWLDVGTGNPVGSLGAIEAGSVSVSDSSTAWLIHTCSGSMCADTLRAFDVRTHQPLKSVSAQGGVNELLLASGGAVLAITSPKGVYPAPPSTLGAFKADGTELFRCQAPGALEASAVLDHGRLIARAGNRISALALPGLRPAPSGWISSRGSFLRTGRSR